MKIFCRMIFFFIVWVLKLYSGFSFIFIEFIFKYVYELLLSFEGIDLRIVYVVRKV